MAAPATPRALYRSYLYHLRWIPDPHIWTQLAPHFKDNLRAAGAAEKLIEQADENGAESSSSAAARKRLEHLRQRVKKDHAALRAAVAYHPKALERLLQKCYGMRGRIRWELIKNVVLTSPLEPADWPEDIRNNNKYTLERRFPPTTFQPLPAALVPLTYVPPVREIVERARTAVPATTVRRERHRRWEEAWKRARVPLVLPPNELGIGTGWESLGVVESLRRLAGLEDPPRAPPPPSRAVAGSNYPQPPPLSPRTLPTFAALPRSLQAAFPRQPVTGRVRDPYPRPPRAHTRDQPKKWSDPMPLTARVLRRLYARLWNDLVWVRVLKAPDQGWKASSYELAFGVLKVHKAPRKFGRASSDDLEWI